MAVVSAQAGDVDRGGNLFVRAWNADEGLGPRSNAKSCRACHFQGGTGGAGDRSVNVDVLTLVMSPDNSFWFNAGFDGQRSAVLHARSDEEGYNRIRFALLGIKPPKGVQGDDLLSDSKALFRMQKAEQRLRRRGHTVTIKAHGAQLELATRNTPPLFGLGEVDEISFATIRRNSVALKKKFPNVSGRLAGRFGWRGQTRTLREFVKAACENELGLNRSDVSTEKKPHVTQRDNWDVEESLTDFIVALPRPRRVLPDNQFQRNIIQNGESVFASIGCVACHSPNLGDVEGVYSDLLLHDMGLLWPIARPRLI
jgi:CxxC motif-containing protein (DUF1111 family)